MIWDQMNAMMVILPILMDARVTVQLDQVGAVLKALLQLQVHAMKSAVIHITTTMILQDCNAMMVTVIAMTVAAQVAS
jgi:hypothetical protein